MRLTIVAALSGIAAVALTMSAPANAAPKQRPTVTAQSSVDVSSQRRRVRHAARPRTRITVHRRSFLDPGTELLPGERKFTDYAIPPTHTSAMGVLDNTAFYHRSPLPGPFDLPGRNNPVQW
jgi:hypothetical protein